MGIAHPTSFSCLTQIAVKAMAPEKSRRPLTMIGGDDQTGRDLGLALGLDHRQPCLLDGYVFAAFDFQDVHP
jgi:hypothetical protein